MRPGDGGGDPAGKHPGHRDERRGKRDVGRMKSPPKTWTNKTMHHPATRIGEIRHGKS